MTLVKRTLLVLLALSALAAAGITWYLATFDSREPSRVAYGEYCAECHGADLSGTAAAPALVNRELADGADVDALIKSIRENQSDTDRD